MFTNEKTPVVFLFCCCLRMNCAAAQFTSSAPTNSKGSSKAPAALGEVKFKVKFARLKAAATESKANSKATAKAAGALRDVKVKGNYARLKAAATLRTGAAGSQGELRCSAIQPTVSTRDTKARAHAASRFGSLRTGLFSGSWGLVQEDSAKRRI